MQANGFNLDAQLNGWPNDARLARIIIHVEVAEAVFKFHPLGHRREFETPEQMFAYAEELREREQHPLTPARLLERGLRAFKHFIRKKGG